MNIDSPSRNQVNTGNKINPVDDPMNLADHAEPVDSTVYFQAYQKAIEHGIPKNTAAVRGLCFHQSDIFCEFN